MIVPASSQAIKPLSRLRPGNGRERVSATATSSRVSLRFASALVEPVCSPFFFWELLLAKLFYENALLSRPLAVKIDFKINKKETKRTRPKAGGNTKLKRLFSSKLFKMFIMILKDIALVSLRGAVATRQSPLLALPNCGIASPWLAMTEY